MVDRCLDLEVSKKIASFIKDLTTSGNPSLNAEKMKGLKKICRTSDLYVEYAFHLLKTQLSEEHSEIRLSAFQIIDELFNRSHAFRELLVSDFQNFLELTVALGRKPEPVTETDQNQPLPPPRSAAVKLRADTLKAIQQWQDKFGGAYKKLSLGYNYLKSCKHVDFSDIRARSQAERRRLELQEERKRKALAAKLDKVHKEIAEQRKDIEDAAMEAENCLELLVPKPDSFLFCKSDFDVELDDNSATKKIPPDVVTSSAGSDARLVTQYSEQSSVESEKGSDGKLNKNSCRNVELKEIDSGEKQIPLPQIGLASVDEDGVSVEERQGKVTENVVHQTEKANSFSKMVPEKIDDAECSQNIHHQVSENRNTKDNGDGDGGDDDDAEVEEFEEENEIEKRMVQTHGLGSRKYNLEIEIGTDKIHVVETADNRDLYQSLKDAACLISMRHLPQTVKWLEVLSKAGASQSEIKAMINLKVRLQGIRAKCTELQIVAAETTSGRQESDSDEEFVEVPEKEGYEPVIPSPLRAEYGLDEVPSEADVNVITKTQSLVNRTHRTKKPEKKLDQPGADLKLPPSVGVRAGSKHKLTSLSWSLSERTSAGSSEDPTSRAANLAKLGLKVDSAGRPSSSPKKPSCTVTSGEASNIPELPFGPDLAHWGQLDKIEAPLVIKNESLHRFWAPPQVETEKPSQMEVAAVVNRTFHYVGDFVPVKWKCRAMLPSGKLCERMDRVKCPFHGKIIPRDENGQPSDPKDVKTDVPEMSESVNGTCETPPWLDSELQADIEAATGHDLGSERSKAKDGKGPKRKGKVKKYPGLTDIREAKNTSRARLETKVFNRSSMKRVASRLDAADYKRLRDKFANQFNYAHKN